MSERDQPEPRSTSGTKRASGPLHLNWSDIAAEPVGEGIERQMIVGDKMMICRLRFAPYVVTPEHEHAHEQMTIIERGHVRFFIEGEERIASPGDVLHFPSGCWHGATMLEEEVILVDIFTPLREDFLGSRDDARENGQAE